MSELKKCPFCGSDRVSFHEDEEKLMEDTTTGFIWCHGCGFSSDSFYSGDVAAEKWNRRAQPENEPLTLEELRQMDNEPIWVHSENAEMWLLCDGEDETESGVLQIYGYFNMALKQETYGKTWLAYRRKPERSEGE